MSVRLLGLAVAAALAAQQPSTSLVGTWRLESFESADSAGRISYPMGHPTAGQLIYDAGGRMSMHLMRPDRPRFAGSDRARGTDAETRAAFVGYLAYYGRYTVDMGAGTVTHHVEGATFPNWIGDDQLRHFRLDGDRLTITTPSMLADGRRISTTLVWRRLPR